MRLNVFSVLDKIQLNSDFTRGHFSKGKGRGGEKEKEKGKYNHNSHTLKL